MITVNSISGGKTSAFMAVHYPADHDVFACVLIDDPSCAPKDAGLVRAVSDKLGMDFTATAERDDTLRVVLELEQLTGRPVTWVHGNSFDNIIYKRKSIPNRTRRFCTSAMKIVPIATWVHQNIPDTPVFCNIGIRYDEQERAKRTKVDREAREKIIIGKHPDGRNAWLEVFWGVLNYPMVTDKVIHHRVSEWAKSTSLPFPADSNCVGCFWKPYQQLRKNWDEEPNKMEWFAAQERKNVADFKDKMNYDQIKEIGIQRDFFFGTDAGCQAGYCTD